MTRRSSLSSLDAMIAHTVLVVILVVGVGVVFVFVMFFIGSTLPSLPQGP